MAKIIYNQWAGNPKGVEENETQCIEEVSDAVGWGHHQCTRKRGYGKNDWFCKQHAKMKGQFNDHP